MKHPHGTDGFATLIVLTLTTVLLSMMTAALAIGGRIHTSNKRYEREISRRIERLDPGARDAAGRKRTTLPD